MACDDLVLEQTANPRAYAASLISFAEKIHRGRELALVNAVVGRVRQISQRVTRILDGKRASGPRAWKPALGLVSLLSGAALAVSSYAPQLVAFKDGSASPVVARHAVPAVLVPAALKAQPSARAAVVPVKLKLRSQPKPRLALARAVRQEVPAPDMTMMVRSMGYDAEGAQVVTLCIWRVREASNGLRTVETMYVVTKI
jgi:hypothetical protein